VQSRERRTAAGRIRGVAEWKCLADRQGSKLAVQEGFGIMTNQAPLLAFDERMYPLAIVFGAAQAAEVLGEFSEFSTVTLLCIDVPRSRYCASVAEAFEFYSDAARRPYVPLNLKPGDVVLQDDKGNRIYLKGDK
jgi:hypothetical protein